MRIICFFWLKKTKHNIPPSEKFFIFSIITKIPFYTKNGKIVRNYLHKISKIKADDNVEKMAITKEIAPYDINNINKELKSIYNSL